MVVQPQPDDKMDENELKKQDMQHITTDEHAPLTAAQEFADYNGHGSS